MKRLIYMSAFARDLTDDEIDALGKFANVRNTNSGITGILLCLNNTFFQILEGDKFKIDNLFESIKRDPRHTDIVCLVNDDNVVDRFFPGRYMHTINLNRNSDMLVEPVKVLLKQLMESHRIIGKYTQPAVIATLVQGLNPLNMKPQRMTNAVFFSDIRGFSAISERFPVDEVVRLVNRYLGVVTDTITEFGGEVTKYIGDCVMAHFSENKADNALCAAVRILEQLALVRAEAPSDSPESLLYTGIGIDYGEVIQGNIGSSVKMDYTLLGGIVNRAQGLERLTRALSVALVFSEEIKNAVQEPWDFAHLGCHPVKGLQNPVNVYTLECPMAYLCAPVAPEEASSYEEEQMEYPSCTEEGTVEEVCS